MRRKLSLLCETQQTSVLMSATYLLGDCHMWEVWKAQPVSSFINQTKFLEDFSSHGAQSTFEPNSKCSCFTEMAAKSAIATVSHIIKEGWQWFPRHFSTLLVVFIQIIFFLRKTNKYPKIRTKKIPHTSKLFCIFVQKITAENSYSHRTRLIPEVRTEHFQMHSWCKH